MSNCCSHGTLLHFVLQSSHLEIYKPPLIKRAYHQECEQKLETRASEREVLQFYPALEPKRKALLLNW